MSNEERLIQYLKIIMGTIVGFWILWELGQIVYRLDLIIGKL